MRGSTHRPSCERCRERPQKGKQRGQEQRWRVTKQNTPVVGEDLFKLFLRPPEAFGGGVAALRTRSSVGWVVERVKPREGGSLWVSDFPR